MLIAQHTASSFKSSVLTTNSRPDWKWTAGTSLFPNREEQFFTRADSMGYHGISRDITGSWNGWTFQDLPRLQHVQSRSTRFPWNMIRGPCHARLVGRHRLRCARAFQLSRCWIDRCERSWKTVKAWWFDDSAIQFTSFTRSSGFPDEGSVFDYFPGAGNKPVTQLDDHSHWNWAILKTCATNTYWGEKRTSRWELWSKKIGSFEIPKDAEVRASQGLAIPWDGTSKRWFRHFF